MPEPTTTALVVTGLLAAASTAATARGVAQASPRISRKTVRQQQQQQRQQRAAQQTSTRQQAAAATTTDPAVASTTRGILTQSPRAATPAPRAALGSAVTRPRGGGVPPGARQPGIGGGDLLRAQLLGALGSQARQAFTQPEPEEERVVVRDPELEAERRRARAADRQRSGRGGVSLAPTLGSASEIVSNRATLLGR